MHSPLRISRSHRRSAPARWARTVLAIALVAGAGRAQTFDLFCVLDAHQETPPLASSGSGLALLTIDTAANTLDYHITFAGLVGAPIDAHIHGPTPPGTPAGILFGLPSFTSPIVGTWNFSELNETRLLTGLAYLNIHTTTFPGGELRGQIVNAISYCWGDGSATACPCANVDDSAGRGCRNSSAVGGMLLPHGSYSVGANDLALKALNLLPGQPALLFSGTNAVNGGNGLVFGDGLRCAGGSVRRLGVSTPNANGTGSWGPGLNAQGAWSAGETRNLQAWYRNPSGSPCGSGFNLSNGIRLTFTP